MLVLFCPRSSTLGRLLAGVLGLAQAASRPFVVQSKSFSPLRGGRAPVSMPLLPILGARPRLRPSAAALHSGGITGQLLRLPQHGCQLGRCSPAAAPGRSGSPRTSRAWTCHRWPSDTAGLRAHRVSTCGCHCVHRPGRIWTAAMILAHHCRCVHRPDRIWAAEMISAEWTIQGS